MKHRILNTRTLTSPYLLLQVELIPENELERLAIRASTGSEASERELELISNYLLFGMNTSLSILSVESQVGSIFTLRAAAV